MFPIRLTEFYYFFNLISIGKFILKLCQATWEIFFDLRTGRTSSAQAKLPNQRSLRCIEAVCVNTRSYRSL